VAAGTLQNKNTKNLGTVVYKSAHFLASHPRYLDSSFSPFMGQGRKYRGAALIGGTL